MLNFNMENMWECIVILILCCFLLVCDVIVRKIRKNFKNEIDETNFPVRENPGLRICSIIVLSIIVIHCVASLISNFSLQKKIEVIDVSEDYCVVRYTYDEYETICNSSNVICIESKETDEVKIYANLNFCRLADPDTIEWKVIIPINE